MSDRQPIMTYSIFVVITIIFFIEYVLAVAPLEKNFVVNTLTLLALGGLQGTAVWNANEWFRIFTAIFLHADPMHYIFNSLVFLQLGLITESSISRTLYISVLFFSGLCGSLMSLFLNQHNIVSVGFSGAIMGLSGMLLIRSHYFGIRRWSLIGSIVPALIPQVTANNLQVDVAAHFGGLLGGIFMGLCSILKNENEPILSPKLNFIATAFSSMGISIHLLSFCIVSIKYNNELILLDNWTKCEREKDSNSLESCSQSAASLRYDRREKSVIFYHLGQIYASRHQSELAMKNFNLAVESNPNFWQAFFARAGQHYSKSDFKAAASDYTESLKLHPQDKFTLNNRALAFVAQGKFSDGIVDFDEALRIDPSYLPALESRKKALLSRSQEYFSKSDFEAAISDLTLILQSDPHHQEALNKRAVTYVAFQKYTEAIADYDEIRQIDPNNARASQERSRALFSRARERYSKSDFDSAASDYTEILKSNSMNKTALNNRGLSYLGSKRYTEAIADFNEALTIDPNYLPASEGRIKALYARANEHYLSSNFEATSLDLTEILKMKPQEKIALNNRGLAYVALGKYQEAINDYDDALKIDPNYMLASQNRARALNAKANKETPKSGFESGASNDSKIPK